MLTYEKRGQAGCLPPEFGICFGCVLEVKLQRHLDLAWGAKGRDLAECATGDAGGWVARVGVIQYIEEVGAEVHVQPLLNLETPR